MLLIRRFEERSTQLYGQGLIGGFCHLYIGQEAVVVGLEDCKQEQDTVVTAYRDHGHMLACGMDPKGVMAELTGRIDGYSKGKGGSMHMFSREKKFFGGHGIVGASASIGTGLGFAHQYNEDNGICMCYFGDGAANQGQTFESFNMAALWKLPVLYIIEDNGYAMGTSVERHSATSEMHKRGEPFGIPGKVVDGMNLLDVRKAGEWGANHVRSGKGPALLHIKTYRYRGHSMSDPANYRSKEEVNSYKENNDPILNLKKLMFNEDIAEENELVEIDKKVKQQILDAVEFSKQSPEPDPAELYTDILIP